MTVFPRIVRIPALDHLCRRGTPVEKGWHAGFAPKTPHRLASASALIRVSRPEHRNETAVDTGAADRCLPQHAGFPTTARHDYQYHKRGGDYPKAGQVRANAQRAKHI